MHFVAQFYARRIVNINVNVLTAGVLAGLLTLIPVHLTRYAGFDQKWVIITVGLVSDIIFDVVIYYVLHWLANHWRGLPRLHRRPALAPPSLCSASLATGAPTAGSGKSSGEDRQVLDEAGPAGIAAAAAPLSFIRDATLVQFERAMLAPVYYGIFLILQWWMLREGHDRELAAFLSLLCGLLVTRVIHTWWMLRQARKLGTRNGRDGTGTRESGMPSLAGSIVGSAGPGRAGEQKR